MSFRASKAYDSHGDSPFEKYNYSRRKKRTQMLKDNKVIAGIAVGTLFIIYLLFSHVSSSSTSSHPSSISKEIPIARELQSIPLSSSKSKATSAGDKEKATLLMLVRNSELHDALASMREIEDRFNHAYHYPWTFLNDVEFTEEFKNYTRGMASGTVEYGLIDKAHWSVPPHIDDQKKDAAMKKLQDMDVIYGGSLSYRHMCRYNSGFFYRHELVQKYDYYWRVEPGIHFYCDLPYDPFKFMRENDKEYSFVLSLPEYPATIPTLWEATQEFVAQNPQFLANNNSLPFITDSDPNSPKLNTPGEIGKLSYNNCHFWSNFEIASLKFWRSEAYTKYFAHLDQQGGFFYERWGDAPVHSIAAALFLRRDQIHHFSDLGYWHVPWGRCPKDEQSHVSGRCLCDRGESFDEDGYSCTPKWWAIAGKGPGA